MTLLNHIKGMNDILPPDGGRLLELQHQLSNLFNRYSYQFCSLPIVERTQLFSSSIGSTSDIIGKEMYSFTDRNQDAISLRPEGTAGVMRSLLQHNLLQQNSLQRLWYMGPFFRYERPQKGRTRQFHQIGAEVIGSDCSSIDVEVIALTHAILSHFDLANSATLQINSLGTMESRQLYRDKLIAYFEQYRSDLDSDSQNRLLTNPLRIFDSKVEKTQQIVKDAPKLSDFLLNADLRHFEQVQSHLENLQINYQINPRLVRGLDYYSHTVFEWTSTDLGSQSAILGGGRYDGLAQNLGSKKMIPACGFALGVERLMLLLSCNNYKALQAKKNVKCFCCYDQKSKNSALIIVEQLRRNCPALQIIWHTQSTNMAKQFSKASKLHCDYCLVVGEEEMQSQTLTVKNLHTDQQQRIAQTQMVTFFNNLL